MPYSWPDCCQDQVLSPYCPDWNAYQARKMLFSFLFPESCIFAQDARLSIAGSYIYLEESPYQFPACELCLRSGHANHFLCRLDHFHLFRPMRATFLNVRYEPHFPWFWRLDCRYLDSLPLAIFHSRASSPLSRTAIFTFLIDHFQTHFSLPRVLIFRLLSFYAMIASEQKFALTVQILFLIAHPSAVELNGEAVHFDFDKIALFPVPVDVQHQLLLNVFRIESLISDFNLRRSWLCLDLE